MLKQNPTTRNLELRISYHGQGFYGWQIQPDKPTVQGALHQALARVLEKTPFKTLGASRTDTGVHAHDQHVNVWTQNPIPMDKLKLALNRVLPQGVRVLSVREAEADFSARYHARAKHYTYYMNNRAQVSPFIQPYVWTDRRHLNHEAMHEAAQHFVGEREFKALQSQKDERPHSTTTIFQTRVWREGDLVGYEVLGHHFLYHMVRNMVGALINVGRGEWTPDELKRRLDGRDRTKMGITAPASGLHLFQIYYEQAPLAFSPDSVRFAQFLNQAPHFV